MMEEPREIGDWSRISVLGSGGFGTVVLWRCSKTDEEVAIKKCKIYCVANLTGRQKERWRNEVQIMKELDNPNIVKFKHIPDFLEEELQKFNPSGLPILSMEYCQKGNLRHVLTQPLNLSGLKEYTVRNILSDISNAVSYLHDRNITHRDIKPENIVLGTCPSREDGIVYKLIDLGYAKELGDATVSFVGTLYYLAPEIFANKKYDFSVDYWSFGIVAFEVICGILPFMPSLNPVERFRVLSNKNPDDICVFKTIHGEVEYSKELFEENQISSCLKNHMEVWLRKVFQLNPKLRSTPFPNSLTVFDQLNSILKKKILKIFIVYKYEFCSYEFDESTSLSTLQLWIERDEKIPKEDQLILGTDLFGSFRTEKLLKDCVTEKNMELFVFKRTSLFSNDRLHVPKLVKVMFEKATQSFSWSKIKAMYAHSILYISQDIEQTSAFSKAMNLYLKHIKSIVSKITEKGYFVRQAVINLTKNVKVFNDRIKGVPRKYKNKDILHKFSELHSRIEKCHTNEYQLALNIEKWNKKVDVMYTIYSQGDKIKIPELQELLQGAVQLLKKTAESADRTKNHLSSVEMLKIICNSMKLKDKLLTDRNLSELASYLNRAATLLESLMLWIDSFSSHVQELTHCQKTLQDEFFLRWQENGADSPSCDKSAIANGFDFEDVLKKRDSLISRFEGMMSDMTVNYHKICDEIISNMPETVLL